MAMRSALMMQMKITATTTTATTATMMMMVVMVVMMVAMMVMMMVAMVRVMAMIMAVMMMMMMIMETKIKTEARRVTKNAAIPPKHTGAVLAVLASACTKKKQRKDKTHTAHTHISKKVVVVDLIKPLPCARTRSSGFRR